MKEKDNTLGEKGYVYAIDTISQTARMNTLKSEQSH